MAQKNRGPRPLSHTDVQILCWSLVIVALLLVVGAAGLRMAQLGGA